MNTAQSTCQNTQQSAQNQMANFSTFVKADDLLLNICDQQPGLDPINKKLQKIFGKSGQIFCFQEIPADFKIFLVSRKKIDGSKFSGFPENVSFSLKNFQTREFMFIGLSAGLNPIKS